MERRWRAIAIVGAVIVWACIVVAPATARRLFAEVGIGGSRMEPFAAGTAGCGGLGLGITKSGSAEPVTPRLEVRAIHGREVPNTSLEDALAGKQSLLTLIGGCDLQSRRPGGPYLLSGLGIGHAWVKEVRGPRLAPLGYHDLTGLAYALGVGLRSRGMNTRMALRIDGILNSRLATSACATTLGVSF